MGLGRSRDTITILHSGPLAPEDLCAATRRRGPVDVLGIEEIGSLDDCPGRVVVIDCDLIDAATVSRLRRLLGRPANKAILFVVPKADRAQYVQACALGADHVAQRPLSASYFSALDDLMGLPAAAVTLQGGISAGNAALQAVFALASGELELTCEEIAQSGAPLADAVAEVGLHRWIAAVNRHHNATYQHCLLVTGAAVAFGQHLGFRRADVDRLLVGALVHDLGKVAVPVDILEKPAALDAAETALMRTHPVIGRDLLERTGRFAREMIEVVGLHHEYLDGSGYPDGRTGEELSDLVRVITIADIFSALVEHRAYRPALAPGEAYDVLRSMTGRLDTALVRAFEPITRNFRRAA